MPVLSVPADDWARWVADNGGLVLDIREPVEWEQGTLPGSTLISMSEIVDRIGELPRDRPILCVCRSGNRSLQVAAYLDGLGFPTVANMVGGLKRLGLQH
jgi:sulfur dioxygenase